MFKAAYEAGVEAALEKVAGPIGDLINKTYGIAKTELKQFPKVQLRRNMMAADIREYRKIMRDLKNKKMSGAKLDEDDLYLLRSGGGLNVFLESASPSPNAKKRNLKEFFNGYDPPELQFSIRDRGTPTNARVIFNNGDSVKDLNGPWEDEVRKLTENFGKKNPSAP